MRIVIVKKTGVLGELDWKKNMDLNDIYKKCGFRKNKDFGKRHTWKLSDSEYVSIYSKDSGRANTENSILIGRISMEALQKDLPAFKQNWI